MIPQDPNKILPQGTKISFKSDNIKITGKIVGCANMYGFHFIGKQYIIEPDKPIKEYLPNSKYEYSHLVAFENQIELI